MAAKGGIILRAFVARAKRHRMHILHGGISHLRGNFLPAIVHRKNLRSKNDDGRTWTRERLAKDSGEVSRRRSVTCAVQFALASSALGGLVRIQHACSLSEPACWSLIEIEGQKGCFYVWSVPRLLALD